MFSIACIIIGIGCLLFEGIKPWLKDPPPRGNFQWIGFGFLAAGALLPAPF